jgi:hypothetical protein
MIRQTGGRASAATSTKSMPASLALVKASRTGITPNCSPSTPMTRTGEILICSLIRLFRLLVGGIVKPSTRMEWDEWLRHDPETRGPCGPSALQPNTPVGPWQTASGDRNGARRRRSFYSFYHEKPILRKTRFFFSGLRRRPAPANAPSQRPQPTVLTRRQAANTGGDLRWRTVGIRCPGRP